MYWAGRTHERMHDGMAPEVYGRLCRRYVYSYYCQMARAAGHVAPIPSPLVSEDLGPSLIARRELHYRKAIELKLLGLETDAAR